MELLVTIIVLILIAAAIYGPAWYINSKLGCQNDYLKLPQEEEIPTEILPPHEPAAVEKPVIVAKIKAAKAKGRPKKTKKTK